MTDCKKTKKYNYTMKTGRPTIYESSMCERYVAMRRKGLSIYEVADEMEICKDTIWAWRRSNEEFSIAFKKGDAAYKAFLIKRCNNNLENKKLNQSLMIFAMKLGGLREHDDALELPADFAWGGSFNDKIKRVDELLASNEVSTETAQRLMTIVSQQADVMQHSVIEQRLEFLENQANGVKNG